MSLATKDSPCSVVIKVNGVNKGTIKLAVGDPLPKELEFLYAKGDTVEAELSYDDVGGCPACCDGYTIQMTGNGVTMWSAAELEELAEDQDLASTPPDPVDVAAGVGEHVKLDIGGGGPAGAKWASSSSSNPASGGAYSDASTASNGDILYQVSARDIVSTTNYQGWGGPSNQYNIKLYRGPVTKFEDYSNGDPFFNWKGGEWLGKVILWAFHTEGVRHDKFGKVLPEGTRIKGTTSQPKNMTGEYDAFHWVGGGTYWALPYDGTMPSEGPWRDDGHVAFEYPEWGTVPDNTIYSSPNLSTVFAFQWWIDGKPEPETPKLAFLSDGPKVVRADSMEQSVSDATIPKSEPKGKNVEFCVVGDGDSTELVECLDFSDGYGCCGQYHLYDGTPEEGDPAPWYDSATGLCATCGDTFKDLTANSMGEIIWEKTYPYDSSYGAKRYAMIHAPMQLDQYYGQWGGFWDGKIVCWLEDPITNKARNIGHFTYKKEHTESYGKPDGEFYAFCDNYGDPKGTFQAKGEFCAMIGWVNVGNQGNTLKLQWVPDGYGDPVPPTGQERGKFVQFSVFASANSSSDVYDSAVADLREAKNGAVVYSKTFEEAPWDTITVSPTDAVLPKIWTPQPPSDGNQVKKKPTENWDGSLIFYKQTPSGTLTRLCATRLKNSSGEYAATCYDPIQYSKNGYHREESTHGGWGTDFNLNEDSQTFTAGDKLIAQWWRDDKDEPPAPRWSAAGEMVRFTATVGGYGCDSGEIAEISDLRSYSNGDTLLLERTGDYGNNGAQQWYLVIPVPSRSWDGSLIAYSKDSGGTVTELSSVQATQRSAPFLQAVRQSTIKPTTIVTMTAAGGNTSYAYTNRFSTVSPCSAVDPSYVIQVGAAENGYPHTLAADTYLILQWWPDGEAKPSAPT